jgi:hypothetical protein
MRLEARCSPRPSSDRDPSNEGLLRMHAGRSSYRSTASLATMHRDPFRRARSCRPLAERRHASLLGQTLCNLPPTRRRLALVVDVDWEAAGGELRSPVLGLGRVVADHDLTKVFANGSRRGGVQLDRLTRPQPQEITVPPQAAARQAHKPRPTSHHRRDAKHGSGSAQPARTATHVENPDFGPAGANRPASGSTAGRG